MRRTLSVTRFIIFPALLVVSLSACAGAPPSSAAPPAPQATAPQPKTPPAQAAAPSDRSGESGTGPGNPAARSETVSTAGWEFRVVEVVRGADAVALLKEASSLNGEHPDAAMEYVVVKVHARYAGTDAGTHHIDATFFRGAGGDGVAYDRVRMTEADPPSPSMSSFEDLTAGGEVEGWVVVQVAKDEAGILLVVHPRDNGVILGDETIRYLSLE